MVICKAVTAPRNGPGTASKGLVVQPYIGDGPIQFPPSQGLSPILTIIDDPLPPLIVSFSPDNCRLIREEFWGLVLEAIRQSV